MADKAKYLYACGTDWQEEIGNAPDLEGAALLYSSPEILKRRRCCWRSCGIVKIKMQLVEWIEPQNYEAEGTQNG